MRKLLVLVALVLACERDDSQERRDPPKPPSPLDGIELPEVADNGFEPADGVTPAVIVSRTALTIDGVQVLALRDGAFAPEDKEGGALGVKVPKLTSAVAKLDPRAVDKPPLVIAFDRRLTYAQLIEVIFSAKQKETGRKRFQILARVGTRLVKLPLVLPDRTGPSDAVAIANLLTAGETRRRPGADLATQIGAVRDGGQRITVGGSRGRPPERPSPPPPPPPPPTTSDADAQRAADPVTRPEPPLKLVVSVTDKILLWSMTGLEGTLRDPKVAIDRASKTALVDLGRALQQIVTHRFTGTTRSADDRTIVFMAPRATQLQSVVELLGALRATPDGKELYPDIQLSAGFE